MNAVRVPVVAFAFAILIFVGLQSRAGQDPTTLRVQTPATDMTLALALAATQQAQPTDRELMQRYIGGDGDAFAAILERYRNEVYNFLVHFTGDTALADDVFQETFLQLHISAATFDTKRELKPWLFTIAANKARDALRSRSRRRVLPMDAIVGGRNGDRLRYGDLVPANVPAPDEAMSTREMRQAVRSIVDKMPENLRAVLLLCYFHEFSYQNIADILNVPLGTVKARIHYAVKDFAKRWKATLKQSSPQPRS
jgi:RNA polymerase sigma-70 factor, ECF subfamily